MKLICYLSNGYPTLEESAKIAGMYAEGGCDIIEIDLPSRNPYLESEYISGRMASALQACDDYDRYMENILRIKAENPGVHMIVLSYENTVKEIGVEKFADFCVNNELKDLIFVGLCDDTIKNQLIERGLRVSCYVQFPMHPEEIASAQDSNGFVYMQAKAEPEKINPKFPTLADCIQHLRSIGIDREIYCGVGVSTPEDFKMVKQSGGDGAFVGSTVLKLYDKPEELKATIRAFKKADGE
ncbi:tryptophan synthase subunit alpha [Clostridium minihomine]|uniref:tryptophan synthase subunit alpha n=1 Tax=Clostridium minihomine TaxID=2045012 RepID=UPI000C7771D9|nr:tryptophan synthase subunit alpha [Clostridium minihomine]